MTLPISITVRKGSQEVFAAEAGRLGQAESACRDFICFASPIIGAAYHHMGYVDAAKRISELGYETSIVEAGKLLVI